MWVWIINTVDSLTPDNWVNWSVNSSCTPPHPTPPRPPGLLWGIHPPCQSRGWGIENFVLPGDWAFSNPGAIPELGAAAIDWCIMLTFAKSNLELEPKSLSPGFPSYIYCNFTLGNSNFPLTQSSFCLPTDHFYRVFSLTWPVSM